MRKYIHVALIMMVLFGFFGCINLGEEETEIVTPQDEELVPAEPKFVDFQIISPSEGGTVEVNQANPTVDVLISTTGIKLVQPGTSAAEGDGYFSVVLDNNEPEIVSSSTYTLKDLTVGEHTIKIELLKGNGASYSPSKIRTVTFTVTLSEAEEKEPETYTMTITSDKKLSPAQVVIDKGDYVMFVNNDNIPHAVSSENGVTTDMLKPGSSGKIKFDKIGVYKVVSTTYPSVSGSVVVNE
ncbi:cupredoxin domain-containing protein [Candidatus Micrarchaeota archaeon]|nr:cupredoxin domain-containing protein [Candidatus Micrarchaeota archaeon]